VRPVGDGAAFFAGFVAAEGCFTGTRRGRRFVFTIGLGSLDRRLCETFPGWLGVGRTRSYPPRRPHYQGETVYAVSAIPDLIEVVVPFMDEHLPPSSKREQYLVWRTELLDHWEHSARRRRT
jgi:hypothetical protein